jgi:hypothetical protein
MTRAPARAQVPTSYRQAALAAGGALTLTGRGDLWVLAIAFGVADASALTALAVALGAAATLARTGSAGLADISGSQAVLGAAGVTGSAYAVAAAWLSAVSLVLVARDRWSAMALGALGGLLVAGPSLTDAMPSVGIWLLGVVGGAAVGWIVAPGPRRARWQPWVAVVVGAGGVCLGVMAGYG